MSEKKIFISSPGDVKAERDAAEKVINEVGKEFQARWRLQTIRWDKDSAGVMLDARLSPQEAVNRQLPLPSECDIVIVILWSRMGTPLTVSHINKADGTVFLSGTEWEYCDAADRRQQQPDGKPAIWVFHCNRPVPDELAKAVSFNEQQNNLKDFLDRICAGGRGGFHTYTTVDEFAAIVKHGLRNHLQCKHFVFAAPQLDNRDSLVGRAEKMKDLIDKLIAGHDQALVYLPGVGKTTLACVIAHNPKLRGTFGGVLWADVGKDTDLESVMKRWAKALEISEEIISTLATFNDWYKAIRDEISSRSNLLIVLDDIWSLDDGAQFRSLGRQCTYLMTTRNRGIAEQLCGVTNVVDIDPLTHEQSLQLLQAYARDEIEEAERQHKKLLDQIIESLDGLPLALEVAGKNLRGKFKLGAPERLKRALERAQEAGSLFHDQDRNVDDWGSRRLIPLLDSYYDELANDDLRKGLRALSVFRPNPHSFTATMSDTICAVDDEQLEELEYAGFIKLRDDGQYLMHRAINEYANVKLSSEERMELHTRALQYYEDTLNKIIADIAGKDMLSYASWYRYENAEWQGLQQARLYHLAAARPDGDRAVGLAILRIYFDAFWWWGYYQPFAFCDALIEKWQHKTQAKETKKLLKTLREFGNSYPEGDDTKKKGCSSWIEVRRALESLRKGAELDGEVSSLSPEQQHIRGLMDLFLAESYAYALVPEFQNAIQSYESACSIFEALGDDWVHSWILFYFADLLKDIGATEVERESNCAKACSHCETSIRLAENMPLLERDPEILGNVYRTLGDIDYSLHNYTRAAKNYFHASAYAYAFNGIPNQPDTYTAEFYGEITGKVGSRVVKLLNTNEVAGRQMFDHLNTCWSPYKDREQQSLSINAALATENDVVAYLFPATPTKDDAENNSTVYRDKVRKVVNDAMFAPDCKHPPISAIHN